MNREYHLTKEGLAELKKELDTLKNEGRKQVVQALQEARAQGDLSENAEYDAARENQGKLEDRIKELEFIIKNAVIITHDGKDDVVNVGKKVTIEYLDGPFAGKIDTFDLVGTLEADPLHKRISTESPVGAAINGKKELDTVVVVIGGKENHIFVKEVR